MSFGMFFFFLLFICRSFIELCFGCRGNRGSLSWFATLRETRNLRRYRRFFDDHVVMQGNDGVEWGLEVFLDYMCGVVSSGLHQSPCTVLI
jgi:hypothetical protein